MRKTAIALGLATALAVLLAAPASGRRALTHQVNVTVTNGGCVLQYKSVSRRNTKILFHIINNGSVAHGFDIWGIRSGFIKPHQEGRFMVNFHRPGRYAYACVTQHGAMKKGAFTIRKS